jgi:hypothetical protein
MSVCCTCCVLSGTASASGGALFWGGPTDCGVSGDDREVYVMRKLWPTGGGGCCATRGK